LLTISVSAIKPAGTVTYTLQSLDRADPAMKLISESGTLRTRVPTGRYRLTTTQPVVVGGRAYTWDLEIPATEPENEVTLSEANVLAIADVIEEPPALFGAGESGTRAVKLRVSLAPELRSDQPAAARLALSIRRADGSGGAHGLFFGTDGSAEVTLPPDRYQLTGTGAAPRPGTYYAWDLEVPATEAVNDVQLNARNATLFDNASVEAAAELTTAAELVAHIGKPPGAAIARQPRAPERRNVAPGITANSTTDDEAQIESLLRRWVESVRSRDLDGLMSCYAPRLDIYFRKKDVTWNDVKRDKQWFFRTYSDTRQIEVSDVQFERNDRGLEATLHKLWEFNGARKFSGEVVSRLTFEKVNGEWRISAERERLVWGEKSAATVASSNP
jgi:ketosteroid isomerase-like protein